jgi:hypothetical protein
MSTTSADPDKLSSFVTQSAPIRTAVGDDRTSVDALAANVVAASPDYAIDSSALTSVASLSRTRPSSPLCERR